MFEAVLQASRIWLDSEEPILDPIFSKLREAFHINDVHPVVDLIHSGLEASARVPRLCETLLGIAKRPEFEESVRRFLYLASRLRVLTRSYSCTRDSR